MDTITHAASGAVVGIALGESRRLAQLPFGKRALIGTLAAAAPDLDNLIALGDNPFWYLDHHRGITHSIILWPVWSLLLGLLFANLFRLRAYRTEVVALVATGIVAHIIGDLITAYGTMVFAPFTDARYALPITFVIDLVFSAILFVGIVFAVWKRAPRPASASLLVLGVYLALQLFMHGQARDYGEQYATGNDIKATAVHVYPQPLSPFRWKIVLIAPNRYHRAYLDFLAVDKPAPVTAETSFLARLNASYAPPGEEDWRAVPIFPETQHIAEQARRSWSQPEFASYRRFAALPLVLRVRHEGTSLCTWFTDMRFALPGRAPPFTYAMCENALGEFSLKTPD